MSAKRTRLLAMILVAMLATTGCGWELFGTISRVSTNPTKAIPNWPVDLSMGLGEARVPVSQLLSTGSGPVDFQIQPDSSYAVKLAPTSIPTVNLSDSLQIPAQNEISFDPVTIPVQLPEETVMPNNEVTVNSLGIMSMTVPVPAPTLANPYAQEYKTIQQVADGPTDVSNPFPIPISENFTKTISLIPDTATESFHGAMLGAGSKVTLDLTNTIGGAQSGTMGLRLADFLITSTRVKPSGIEVNELAASASVPVTTGTVEIPLTAGKAVTSYVSVSFKVVGQVPPGFNLRNLSGTQLVRVGGRVRVNVAKLALPAREIPAVTKSLDLPSAALTAQGIGSLSEIKIATGSATLRINNGFGFHMSLSLELQGIKDAQGNVYKVQNLFIPAKETSTHSIPLSGVTITSLTGISARVTGRTYKTDAVLGELPEQKYELAPSFMADWATGQSLAGGLALSTFEIDGLQATIKKDVEIPATNAPINLPQQIKDLKVDLASVSIQFQVDNRSLLPASLVLDAKATMPDGEVKGLEYTGDLSIAKADAAGITRSTVIEINERNSRLVDILNRGATSVSFGGKVSIDSGTTPVRISRQDSFAGRVAVSVPISLIFPEMGVGKTAPPYDVKPATTLPLDYSTRQQLTPANVSRLAITLEVENGLRVPLVINLMFGAGSDPFSDPTAMTKSLALGNGSAVQTSVLELSGDEITTFAKAVTLGVRLTSPGSDGKAITLRSTDGLKLGLRLAAKLNSALIKNAAGAK